MRIWVFASFLVIFAKCAANGTKTTKTGHGEPVVFNQYIGQGAVTSDAIKKLDEKLGQLINCYSLLLKQVIQKFLYSVLTHRCDYTNNTFKMKCNVT